MKVKIGKYKDDGSQKVKIRIDKWDTYSADVTMSTIIHPLLVKFKDSTSSYPTDIQDDSIPDEITDDADKWDWILGEMIHAHLECINKFDIENYRGDKDHSRALNGMRLFGKYYGDLWD